MPMWKKKFRQKRRIKRRRRSVSAATDRSKKIAKLSKLVFGLVLLGIVGLFIVLPLFAFDLPSPDKVVRREGFSTKILDRNGEVLYDIYQDERRTPVEISDVPDYLKQATIAIEDKNFYEHEGFDPFGITLGSGNFALSLTAKL